MGVAWRLVLCNPDGTERAPITDALKSDWTLPASGVGSFSMSYPRAGQHWAWMEPLLRQQVNIPVALYLDGVLAGDLYSYLVSSNANDASSALRGEVVSITGIGVGQEMYWATIDIDPNEAPYLPTVASTFGQFVVPLLTRAQNKMRALTGWRWDFDVNKDSNGQPWSARVLPPSTGRAPVGRYVDTLVTAKAGQYRIRKQRDGTTLMSAYNWGTIGQARPGVAFHASRDSQSVPRQVGNTERCNALVVLSKDGTMKSIATDEAAISLNGGHLIWDQEQLAFNPADQAAMDSAARQILTIRRSSVDVVRLTGIDHGGSSVSPVPIRDYLPGDLVTNRSNDVIGFELVPVQQIALTMTTAGTLQSGVELGADYRQVKVRTAAEVVAGAGTNTGAGYTANTGGIPDSSVTPYADGYYDGTGTGGGGGEVGTFKTLSFAATSFTLPDLTDLNTEEQTCTVEVACEPPPPRTPGSYFAARAIVTLDGRIGSGDATALAFGRVTTTFGMDGVGIIAQGGPVYVEATGPQHVSFSCSSAGMNGAFSASPGSKFFASVTLTNDKPNQGYSRPLATQLRMSVLVTWSEQPYATVS